MSSPEQFKPEEKKMSNNAEKREDSKAILRILKETEEKCRKLYTEVEVLTESKDATGAKANLKERAQLLVDLPRRLEDAGLEKLEESMRDDIRYQAEALAYVAEKALEGEKDYPLITLFTEEDANSLKDLIEELES